MLLLAGALAGCAPRHVPSRPIAALTAKTVPRTPDEAMLILDLSLSLEDRKEYADSTGAQLTMRHFGFGTGLRNEWGLWGRKSELYRWFKRRGVTHPEEISGILIAGYFHHVNGFPADFEARCSNDGWSHERSAKLKDALRRMERKKATSRELTMLEPKVVPSVRIPARTGATLSPSHPVAYAGGLILSSFRGTQDFGLDIEHLFFHPAQNELFDLEVDGLDELESVAVDGETIWASGRQSGERVVVRVDQQLHVFDPPERGRLVLVAAPNSTLFAISPHALYRLDGRTWTTVRPLAGASVDVTHARIAGDRLLLVSDVPRWPTTFAEVSLLELDARIELGPPIRSIAHDGSNRLWLIAYAEGKRVLARQLKRLEVLSLDGKLQTTTGVRSFSPSALAWTPEGMLIGAADGLYRYSERVIEPIVEFDDSGPPLFVQPLDRGAWLLGFEESGVVEVRCDGAECAAVWRRAERALPFFRIVPSGTQK